MLARPKTLYQAGQSGGSSDCQLVFRMTNEATIFSSHELHGRLNESWPMPMFLTWEQVALRLLETRRREPKLAIETLHTSLEIVALLSILNIDDESSVRGKPSLFEMLRWLKQLGHTISMDSHYVTRTWLTLIKRLLTSIASILYT